MLSTFLNQIKLAWVDNNYSTLEGPVRKETIVPLHNLREAKTLLFYYILCFKCFCHFCKCSRQFGLFNLQIMETSHSTHK